jgi:hypothetical protein
MDVLVFIGAGLTILWGFSHLFATRGTLSKYGFVDMPSESRRIITMEWIVEGVALVSTGAYIATVTAVDSGSSVATAVYAVAIITLVTLAIVSLFTGFRVAFLPFRLCPAIFILSAVLIAVGAWIA